MPLGGLYERGSQGGAGSGGGYGSSYGSSMGTLERREGPFRGRGPKGYRRSDDRIKEDVSERLRDDPNIDASEIEVEVQNGIVTLTGTVNSRREKRAAADCAEDVSGVDDVTNNLRVQKDGDRSDSGRSSAGSTSNAGSRGTTSGSTSSTSSSGTQRSGQTNRSGSTSS